MVEVAEAVKDAQRALAKALDAVVKAETDLATAHALAKADGQPYIMYARLRDDDTIDSQTLRLSKAGALGNGRYPHRGRLVRLLAHVDPRGPDA